MNKKESRPSWFKMFRNQKALIDSVPDAEVGQALKAVFQYFENGEVVEMSPLVFAVFSSVKPYVDESYDDFEDGKKRMTYTRWKGLHPDGTDEEFERYYSKKTNNDVTGFAEGDEEHGGKSQLLSELIVVLCALLGAVIGSIVTPGVGTVVGMGLGLILGLSIYSVRKDPKKGTQRLVSIGRSVLLGLLAGVLGVGLAALGIVSAGMAFIISAAIGLALKFFVDSVDDSKVRKATSGFTGTRVSTKAPTRRRRVAAQSLDGNAPVYNEIPALASGAVIPPNRKFLAVLGDQKSGTNIETPIATMVDAFKQAMAESGGGATTVVIQLDGKEIARSTVKNINNMTRAAGKPVLLY